MNALEILPIPIEARDFAVQVAIGGMCVCAMALAVAGFMRRRSEPLRYAILLTGVIGLLAVPALVGLGRTWQGALPWFAAQPEGEVVKVPAEMLPELLNRAVADPPEGAAESPGVVGEIIGAGLLAFWGLGTLIGIGRLLWALWKQSRALVGLPLRADFWTDDLKAQLAQKLGLHKFPAVHHSLAAPMPMVIGIWRPTIVLPDPAPASWEQPQWEAVLLHEAAHIARGDHWAGLAQRVAVILFWWCPLVHLMARRLNALRENICDDCALQGPCDRFAYAELLVESAEHFLSLTALPVPLGLLDSARGGLEVRVKRLLEKEKPTMTKLSLPGKLLGAALLVAACLLTAAGTAFSGGQPPPQKKIQIKIIVDGKEIDLNDTQLWHHIEAAQRKAAGEKQIQLHKGILGGKPDQPDGARIVVNQAEYSPDGKLVVTADGARIIVLDTKSGRIVAQADQSKADKRVKHRLTQDGQLKPDLSAGYRLLGEIVQSKLDPRIEELVKQAEAIKPGSGAEIRRALQAVPKPSGTPKDPKAVKPLTSSVRLWDTDTGKKVIILAIENGKVLQLNEADLKKFLDKGIRVHLDVDVVEKGKADQKALLDLEKARLVDWLHKVSKDKVGDKKPAPTPASADLEALSRQLERINAELRDLRKRLEAGKK
jgi:beta-lactamase regulating signal transducer with metallopeptidase domain